MNKELIRIGKILKTHGLKGGFRVFPLCDNIFHYDKETVFLLKASKEDRLHREEPYLINYIKGDINQPYIHLESINDIDTAKSFTGMFIAVTRDMLPPLKEDEYYFSDLIGMSVILDTGEPYGFIEDIYDNSGQEILSINHNNEEYMVPFVKKWILNIDINNNTVIVDSRYFSNEED